MRALSFGARLSTQSTICTPLTHVVKWLPCATTISVNHSPSFDTLAEVAMGFFSAPAPDGLGLCPAGAQYLLGQLAAAAAEPGSGIDMTWVTSNRTVQAGGLDNATNPRARQNLSNGKGIDHLGENAAIGTVIGANIGTAIGMCS